MGKFFVTGSTGDVGQQLCKLLVENGHSVHALTRDPNSAAAQKLAGLGDISLFQGSFDDLEVLATAATGCSGVFLNPSPDFQDHDAECRHARNVTDASLKAGVKTCVYMSVNAAGTQDSWPEWIMQGAMASYWLSKHKCQEVVKAAGFDQWTLLQPCTFMTNYAGPRLAYLYPKLQDEPTGTLVSYNDPNLAIPLVDPKDIGQFAMAALVDPLRFDQQVILLNSDKKTIAEIAQAMAKVSGKEIKPQFLDPNSPEGASNRMAGIARWVDEMDPRLDFSAKDKFGITVSSFEQYLEREKETVLKALRKA